MNRFFLIAILMMFVAACTSQNSTPIATSLPISSIARATIMSTRTSTPKITPTLTLTPKHPDQILNSPNGEYIAEFDNAYSHPASESQIIKILDKNSSLLWQIPYQHETSMAMPHPSLVIYGWSKDSAYLYFYYYFSPDGGDRAFWWNGFDVQRINIQTGAMDQVIPSEREQFVAFAFSPNEMQIAYTRQQDKPSIIYIRDLETGKEKAVTVIFPSKNYVRVGDIHWSPSGKEIAFQTEAEGYLAQIIYLNSSTTEQKLVHEYKVDMSYFQGWSDDGTLEFLDIENGNNIVHVNPRSNETIIIGTPTPHP